MTDKVTKAKIIQEFTIEESANVVWEEWFSNNDLGVPLAILYANDFVSLRPVGEEILEETWSNLCRVTMADPAGNYSQLSDMLLNFDPTVDDEDDE